MPRIRLLAILLMLLFTNLASGQSAEQQATKKDPHTSGGRLVSKGQNARAVGTERLLTYLLEEVDLPEAINLQIRGKARRLNSVLRLTISSESIQGAHTIWIDDAALTGVFGLGRNAIGVFVYDPSILRDGAEISVSDGNEVVTLPEKLSLPKDFDVGRDSLVEDGNQIVGIRSVLRIIGSVRQPVIQIEMRTRRGFPIRNAALSVQIGKQFFSNGLAADAIGHSLVLNLPAKMFEQLKDGAEVVAFYNIDRSGASGADVWYFGRLNKSMLDR